MNLLASLLVLLAAAVADDAETWNRGVQCYSDGDVTNALRILERFTGERMNGESTERAVAAAGAVAKLEHDAGLREYNAGHLEAAVGHFENAAKMAQLALRAAPDDETANGNYTRAVEGLAGRRREARLRKILQGAQGKDPGAMLLGAMHEARAIFAEAGTYWTNAAPKAVAAADRLSARSAKLADTWIPVKEAICQSVTNEEQAAMIVPRVEAAEKKTREAAEKLGDLDHVDGYAAISEVENTFNQFAKMTAPAPSAMDEDLVAQSNAWQDVETVNGRAWQPEALDWTRSFRRSFPAWARAYQQQAQADTNKPPFTAEDQAKVAALATELEQLQMGCVEKVMPPDQEKALRIIDRIRELLPKDKNGGGGQSQQNQPNQDQQQQQDQKQDQQQDRQNQDQPQEKQEQDPNEQQQDEKEQEAQADEQEKPDDREVEDVLKKAQERSDEHDADKKARMRKAPLPPNERDW